jgi:hypothetical protein
LLFVIYFQTPFGGFQLLLLGEKKQQQTTEHWNEKLEKLCFGFLSFCLSVFLPFCLSVFMSFCLSVLWIWKIGNKTKRKDAT